MTGRYLIFIGLCLVGALLFTVLFFFKQLRKTERLIEELESGELEEEEEKENINSLHY